jgi:HD-like signal output (HDOD) protein
LTPPLKSLFAQTTRLPVVPKVAQALIQSLGKIDVAVGAISAQIGADPVISAKILRLANSAYFRASRTIASIDGAVQMLGFAMVRNLVVGCSMIDAFQKVPGLDLPRFWRCSVATACAARWLAQQTDEDADLAFTVGLMHGLGQLVLHTVVPDVMIAIDARSDPLAWERARVERDHLQYDYADVSAELALSWKFPEAVAAQLREVTDPLRAAAPSPVASWVHVGAWRARAAILAWTPEEIERTCPLAVGRALHRPFQWLEQEATLAGEEPAAMGVMPPIGRLTEGLDLMLT